MFTTGFAGFLSPETTTTIDAFSGDMVELDARVNYTGAGSSNHNQTVTVLHLFKLMDNSRSLVYFCGNENSRQGTPCPSTNRVTATSGTYKYDLTLYLNNVTRNDGGRYQARVELLRPGVSSRSYIRKEFVIQVHRKCLEYHSWTFTSLRTVYTGIMRFSGHAFLSCSGSN